MWESLGGMSKANSDFPEIPNMERLILESNGEIHRFPLPSLYDFTLSPWCSHRLETSGCPEERKRIAKRKKSSYIIC